MKGDVFKVERVLDRRRKRGRGGKYQILVKWLGWDDTHNEWIDEDQVVDQYEN